MTTLLHSLGLSTSLQFHDVYSISDPSLLSFIPRPAHALLLVFPVTTSYETFRQNEDISLSSPENTKEVIWFKQTIRNACGLIGLLHAACNPPAKTYITPSSALGSFLSAAIPLNPTQRARLIATMPDLAIAHAAAAVKGDTPAPSADDNVELHFVCFVKSETGNLWELDGSRKGPLNRGKLDEDDDVLSEKALDLGVRAFLKREEELGGGDLRFSLVALAPGLD